MYLISKQERVFWPQAKTRRLVWVCDWQEMIARLPLAGAELARKKPAGKIDVALKVRG